MPTLLDTHYHLDFIPSLAKQVDFVQHRHQGNKGIVAQTVLPSKFAALSQTLDEFGGSQPLLSLEYHPWWIPSGSQQEEEEMERFNQYIHQTHLIGEIGLDYSPKRIAEVPASLQNQIFTQLLETDLPESIADQSLQVEDYIRMHQESMQTTLEALIQSLGEDIIETIQHTQQALYHYPSSIE
ncbi:TatD family hydrolase [Falseniella ignava]|uniref:TatD family hydrolase n=1 Tax=Falseniella ignava CCUG 37419 TaxID=883112 RepID=K1MDE2_9LACT|nr:TatD family hydrolase [Falseniella ignava]EKB54099.1 hypothetical protein HMPREF9707_01276 [Falseniella ignava CCUG 37419]